MSWHLWLLKNIAGFYLLWLSKTPRSLITELGGGKTGHPPSSHLWSLLCLGKLAKNNNTSIAQLYLSSSGPRRKRISLILHETEGRHLSCFLFFRYYSRYYCRAQRAWFWEAGKPTLLLSGSAWLFCVRSCSNYGSGHRARGGPASDVGG